MLFAYATVFLFLGLPGLARLRRHRTCPRRWLTVAIVAGLLFFPILGNLRPDLVSFLPSMRQYAGNWASAVWAFAPGAEAKLNSGHPAAAKNQVDQFIDFGYEPQWAEVTMQQPVAWRTMHSQGRGLNSVLMKNLARHRHLHRARGRVRVQLAHRVQLRRRPPAQRGPDRRDAAASAAFDPGELVVVWVESQGWGQQGPALQGHRCRARRDRAGHLDRWPTRSREQPWLPNGPIPTEVTWSL